MLNNNRGFTLVELLVVIVIIAVLVLVATPLYKDVQRQGQEAAHDSNVKILTQSAAMYLAENAPLQRGVKWPDEDSYLNYIETWPEPCVRSGSYSVTISESGQITVVPGVRVYGW